MTSPALPALVAVLTCLLVPLASATDPAPPEVEQAVRAMLQNPPQNLPVEAVTRSEIEGLYAVELEDGSVIHASPNGRFLIVGDMFAVDAGGFTNLAEKRREAQRAGEIAEVPVADMIVFPAEGETRSHISVFTDITCFYCQKLHLEVPELNRRGVEVRYLAFPRGGMASEGYRKLVTAWCAEDPPLTLTRLKAGERVEDIVCEGTPIMAQFELGQILGVRGTPAIITATGKMIPGYQAADELLKSLGLE